MNKRSIFFKTCFLAVAMCAAAVAANAQVFMIERGSASLPFYSFIEAIEALQDDDKLYLPAGEFASGGYTFNARVIDKKVDIFGAGYTASGMRTHITGLLELQGSGTTVTGVSFDHLKLFNISNSRISRCVVETRIEVFDTGSNIIFVECIFPSLAYVSVGSYVTYVNFSNCIFEQGNMTTMTTHSFGSATVAHCLFIPRNGSVRMSASGANFHNNIFRGIPSMSTVNNSSFKNNLWIDGEPTGMGAQNVLEGCITNVPLDDVFTDFYARDFTLKANSPGKNAALDGTDVGIFGSTTTPFKANALPSIPAVVTRSVGAETDASGQLPVNIVVEAQAR